MGKNKKQTNFKSIISEEELQKAIEKREAKLTEDFITGYRELCIKTKRQIAPQASLQIAPYDPTQDARVQEEVKASQKKAKKEDKPAAAEEVEPSKK